MDSIKSEILFRGQRKDNKQWVYGYYIPFTYEVYGSDHTTDRLGHFIMEKRGDDWQREEDNYVEVIPETVGQKVGQLHYSGDNIPFFEGDITEDIYGENRGVVMFEYDQWVVKTDTRNVNIGSCSDWVYLGTIHTHPEVSKL